jgi:hypothetical protein
VEAIDTMRGLPPVYLRTQQLSWLEITAGEEAGNSDAGSGAARPAESGYRMRAELKSARVELPGATRLERFISAARNPHTAVPTSVASWPSGNGWPSGRRHVRDRKHLHKQAAKEPQQS